MAVFESQHEGGEDDMIAEQLDIFGGSTTAGDVVAKITHLLETEPKTRDNYKLLMWRYWREYDGLDRQFWFGPAPVIELESWFVNKATSPKTIQNRAMEIQRRRPDLAASPQVQERRQRQATQGVVR